MKLRAFAREHKKANNLCMARWQKIKCIGLLQKTISTRMNDTEIRVFYSVNVHIKTQHFKTLTL